MADDKQGEFAFWNNYPLWGFLAALFITLILADSIYLYFSFDWTGFDPVYLVWLRTKPFLSAIALIAIREISKSPAATYSAIALGAFLSMIYWYSLKFCGAGAVGPCY